MKLWQIWLPPIEKPENVRVVRLLGSDFVTTDSQRRARRTYYSRNREKLAKASRDRYRAANS